MTLGQHWVVVIQAKALKMLPISLNTINQPSSEIARPTASHATLRRLKFKLSRSSTE
jgi:hypothetical protein